MVSAKSPIRKLQLTSVAMDPQQITNFTNALHTSSSPLTSLVLVDTGIENYENMTALTAGLADTHLESLSIMAVEHTTEEYGIRAITHLFAKITVPYVAAGIKTVNDTAAYRFADVLIANEAIRSFSLQFDPAINKLFKGRIESSGKFSVQTEVVPSGFIYVEKDTWTRL
eukprot:Phypoly_transcript_15042.p1 GENE.Phypoly_transcript_15042~~Phypoly_transcript_15042.p1  ORF type:complete len:170 (+),score=19.15 Phypoly_transcript_15042:418-927(+)